MKQTWNRAHSNTSCSDGALEGDRDDEHPSRISGSLHGVGRRIRFFRLRPRELGLSLAILMGVALLGNSSLRGGKIPDFTAGDELPPTATHDWNLGPTGARGWIYSDEMETRQARQIYVTEIEQGSPADSILQIGDVLLGIGQTPFSDDPRSVLGRAIGQAEANDGKLTLLRWREGRVQAVYLRLAVLGEYAETAPFACGKSQQVFDRGVETLANKMKANPTAGNGIVRCFNALALLASGREDYLPLVRQQVEWAAEYRDPQRRSLHSWFYGPVNLLLAEYILATGDQTFLPSLRRTTKEIVEGQSAVGSWGHKFVQGDGRLTGYGMMNAPGLPLTVSLVLAREAGIDDPKLDEAIDKSARLLRFYVGKGSVPYGDHHPWIQTHEDNGKNGIAAVLYNLLGDWSAAEYFSRMSVASYGAERDTGHTGNFFNMLWAMPGVALSGPEASGAWMKEFGWYYDLARRWDGSFIHQGPPAIKYDSYRRWDATGAYLLAFAQPRRTIHLTGKKSSRVPQVTRSQATALIADGRDWSPSIRKRPYATRDTDMLWQGLTSWSPVVRDRSATELARRQGDWLPRLVEMLEAEELETQLGAAQALGMMRGKAASAVPALQTALQSDDLWLRIQAADALAAIGKPALVAAPELLEMLTRQDLEKDPRSMQQRYLCFALFDRRQGLLRQSLEDLDSESLRTAVRAGLRNDDGRARGAVASVYRNLSFEQLRPLFPAIHEAIAEPAPSGIMFSSEIRMRGLELFAKHHVAEGIDLLVGYARNQRKHGSQRRLPEVMKMLVGYGEHAQRVIPELEAVATYFETEETEFPRKLSRQKAADIRLAVQQIKASTAKPKLLFLN
ncbi:MAG: acetylesterase [Planctomycetaceae bacterium]|nr:acetylesterase [Planctomycetaceae bacterium]